MINSLKNSVASLVTKTINRYRLDIPSCTSSLDVEHFSGSEGMSQTYHYTITFTSPDKDIDSTQLLSKPVSLTMGAGLLQSLTDQKVVHGVVTRFERISSSADEATFVITLEPFLSLLDRQFRTHRFFVNESVPEVVGQILNEHGLKGWEYEFILKQTYPKREQINQYQESDLEFIQRLLSEVGIFYFFTLQPDTQTEVVHFADKQSAYKFGKTLPLNSPSGMSDTGAESVWGLNVRHSVVAASVITKDYNHREAQKVLQSVKADMTRGEGEGITYGEVYHYKPRHLDTGDKIQPTAETANFLARLDHERFLSDQTWITGVSNDVTLHPAQVLTVIDKTIPSTLPELLSQPMVIVRTGFTASRKDALKVNISAVPYSETLCWRPALKPRPKVSGTLMARVTSAKDNDIYAWQDEAGLYRVKFDADQDEKVQGQESMPVRLAKPYGGDVYGIHFPLIQGTEVAIAFHDGDPDRPYIAHALHDSRHVDHVTEKNNTRNVIRTPALNKIRLEDKRGEEHIKLSTEYGGKTQLNLGHNVDASRALRGEGAELRTDDWAVIRGGKGILLTADSQPGANGQMLEMDEAIAQLEQALTLARSLAKAVETAKATPGDIDSQKALNQSLEKLNAAGILASAPAGIGIVSPAAVRVASGSESVGVMAGSNTDISAGKNFTVAAGESVSLFAQAEGMKLFAGKGKVDIQAQGDALSMLAKNDIEITSTETTVTITAAKELVLTCGGGYIKLSGGNIEIADPQNILFKSANWQKMGPADMHIPPLKLPTGFEERFTVQDQKTGEIVPYARYRITTEKGEIFEGRADAKGKTAGVYTATPESVKVELL
ncbi:type VI secretion system tip protein VgrG [Lelliottia sp. V89_10]|uniref:type VI secretion system Vgr family protein n=1 Tax=Lelliottia wanjuensis TaxID=3050585 RepID=UPI00249E44D1|nr:MULTISPECIES: type VI secretion system Vgr family protein [unclassified Lelliottia]MDI3360049.1 type VI secretion system tip protein VgrG [Lelliottia sp. V89_13]MDK9548275.1 type VI secretion system tip protein VgrG [Lelliottia sp. V89_5]MDK9594885.1 type VI secretion system tip protein VgrG [Lelliottia sp. V89_10]